MYYTHNCLFCSPLCTQATRSTEWSNHIRQRSVGWSHHFEIVDDKDKKCRSLVGKSAVLICHTDLQSNLSYPTVITIVCSLRSFASMSAVHCSERCCHRRFTIFHRLSGCQKADRQHAQLQGHFWHAWVTKGAWYYSEEVPLWWRR